MHHAVASACRSGSKPAVIGGKFKCLKVGQRCQKRYEKQYRKYGFRCVSGRLRKYVTSPPPAPTPPPAPQPPPPPPGQPGHYKGLTSQNEDFEFDVTSDGRGVRGLITGQINQGCTPGGSLYGGNQNFGSYVIPIASDGSFTFDQTFQTSVDVYPATAHLRISGHLAGAVGVGNLRMTTTFTYSGTPYSCESGLLTWTATRTS
jgi:hypothetical protein